MLKNNVREFILMDKKEVAENVTSLYFKPTDGLKFVYVPGQYVNIKSNLSSGHAKSYTISSIPSEKFVCITIKKKGEVSSAIIDVKIGDKLNLDGPYGHCFPEENSKEIVMLAGGIGVTPFYSIIKSKLKSQEQLKITIFYSNKTLNQTTFFKELNKLSESNSNFKIIYCLTGGDKKNSAIQEYSRINEKILNKYLVTIDNKCYYVCGSVGFVNDMWKFLKDVGILEESIFTETFY